MPLFDHFHPPWKRLRPWEGVHSTWATLLAQRLNHGWLPPGFVAVPQIRLGGQIEIDVATLEPVDFESHSSGDDANGSVAVWAPPQPAISTAVEFGDADTFEVQVFDEQDTPRLVAAIELVSPANKDRERHRRAFVVKCASYLRAGVGLLVVDVVTSRTSNLHEELLRLLHVPAGDEDELYACAYRLVPAQEDSRLDVWTEELAVGAELPTMPLWLNGNQCVPVDLEAAYTETCEALLIR